MVAANATVTVCVVVDVVVTGRGVEKTVGDNVTSTVMVVLALGSDKVVYCVLVVVLRTVDCGGVVVDGLAIFVITITLNFSTSR